MEVEVRHHCLEVSIFLLAFIKVKHHDLLAVAYFLLASVLNWDSQYRNFTCGIFVLVRHLVMRLIEQDLLMPLLLHRISFLLCSLGKLLLIKHLEILQSRVLRTLVFPNESDGLLQILGRLTDPHWKLYQLTSLRL